MLIAGSFVLFVAVHLTTDPVKAAIHHNVSTDALIKFKHDLGLDKPLLTQYWLFLTDFFRGDFGTSYTSQGAVWPVLRTASANSLVLGVFAAFFYVIVGVAVGVISVGEAVLVVRQHLHGALLLRTRDATLLLRSRHDRARRHVL